MAKQGFASMPPEKARVIQQRGGQAVQASGRGNRFSSETAKAAAEKRWAPKPADKSA